MRRCAPDLGPKLDIAKDQWRDSKQNPGSLVLRFLLKLSYKMRCVCVCVCVCACIQLCPTLYNPWTVARQVPLSMGFSKQE